MKKKVARLCAKTLCCLPSVVCKFLEATKLNASWERGSLAPALETSLQEYTHSAGTEHGEVPSEIPQGAALIAPEHASVNMARLAQCVGQEDVEGSEARNCTWEDTPDNSAGNTADVLVRGVGDTEPLKLRK